MFVHFVKINLSGHLVHYRNIDLILNRYDITNTSSFSSNHNTLQNANLIQKRKIKKNLFCINLNKIVKLIRI